MKECISSELGGNVKEMFYLNFKYVYELRKDSRSITKFWTQIEINQVRAELNVGPKTHFCVNKF